MSLENSSRNLVTLDVSPTTPLRPLNGDSIVDRRTEIVRKMRWMNTPEPEAIVQAARTGNFDNVIVRDHVPGVDDRPLPGNGTYKGWFPLTLLVNSVGEDESQMPVGTARMVLPQGRSLFNQGGFLCLDQKPGFTLDYDERLNGQEISANEIQHRLVQFEDSRYAEVLARRMAQDKGYTFIWERYFSLDKDLQKSMLISMFEMTKTMNNLSTLFGSPLEACYLVVEPGGKVESFIKALLGNAVVELVRGASVSYDSKNGQSRLFRSLFSVVRLDGGEMVRVCDGLLDLSSKNIAAILASPNWSIKQKYMAKMLKESVKKYGRVNGRLATPATIEISRPAPAPQAPIEKTVTIQF